MFKLLKYLTSKEWLLIGVSLVFIVASVWLDLKLPDYMSKITELIQTSGAISEVWLAGGYMILCTLGSLVAAIIVGFFAARIGASFSQRVRSLLFNKVESFSMEEINRFSTSSLITRSTNDITQVQMLIVLALQLVIKAPILAVWAIFKIAGKGFEWSLATGVAVLGVSIMVVVLMVFLVPKFKKMQTLTDNITRVTRENLMGLRVVRAYNAEDYQKAKFEAANKELTDTHLFAGRALALMLPTLMVIMNLLSLAIYWIGAFLIDAAQLATDKLSLFTDMVIFSTYAMMVIMSFMMLVIIFIMWPRASVSAKRINEVLDTEPRIIDGVETTGKSGLVGEVVFNNVSFKYPDAVDFVLKNVSFTAKQGETVAFIGSTGSGKSTLINLIPRFFDVTEGEVLIDGVNVKDYKLEALCNKIGYVPQKAVLFKGTVEFNVAYGDNGGAEFSIDEVKKAIQIAQGTDFVEKMPDGYGAAISQGGTNVSGGQKQRLAIARAVCRKPEIYIFDDSFSALDYKTDRILRSALKQETAGVTSLIVAQRIGTIMDADQIIVLDEGKIVGKGTHNELLRNCVVYKEIAMSQLNEEELYRE
ncbi:MAG: ABC transporter ATP-binding protein/permease [Nitrososphaerota archaeon]|nr:ABC transporter ATP-binding protein/permease [Nitrososphaerota archaeon]